MSSGERAHTIIGGAIEQAAACDREQRLRPADVVEIREKSGQAILEAASYDTGGKLKASVPTIAIDAPTAEGS